MASRSGYKLRRPLDKYNTEEPRYNEVPTEGTEKIVRYNAGVFAIIWLTGNIFVIVG